MERKNFFFSIDIKNAFIEEVVNDDGRSLRTPKLDSFGRLHWYAPIARHGIVRYANDKSELIPHLVPTKELKNALPQVMGLPITDGHPDFDKVTRNVSKYAKGTIMNAAVRDGVLYAHGMTTDKETIKNILNKTATEISVGYSAEMDLGDNHTRQWNGANYKIAHKNLKFNQVGMVPRGRLGPTFAVDTDNMDQIDGSMFNSIEDVEQFPWIKNHKEIMNSIEKAKQKEDDMAENVTISKERLEELENTALEVKNSKEKANAEREAEFIRLEKKNEELSKQLEDLKNNSTEEQINKIIEEKLTLAEVANTIEGVNEASKMTVSELKKVIVSAVYPKAAEKGEDIINALLEDSMAEIKNGKKGDRDKDKKGGRKNTPQIVKDPNTNSSLDNIENEEDFYKNRKTKAFANFINASKVDARKEK